MTTHRFEAMGCEVSVGGGTPDEHFAIRRLFVEREVTFSRFISESELNGVNASAGRLVLVSQLFADTLNVALIAAEETGGLVAPILGAALEAAGYTSDLAQLAPAPQPPESPPASSPVFARGRLVQLPVGVKLDLNGVVKSLAVDDALALLSGDGFVSAGGDLAARGELTVALPDGQTVSLRRGALATSGTTKRWWLRAGTIQHHLIDPRTHRPSTSPWAQVTACGATCLAADIAAKAGFLLGHQGPDWLDERGIPARFLLGDGRATSNDAWQRSMGDVLTCI
ncbi:MAG: FAD:protein FMN transferase [Actinomycetota bacterium]|nr:FAD:protein FMN transferase [Actinomycetota bacterium]